MTFPTFRLSFAANRDCRSTILGRASSRSVGLGMRTTAKTFGIALLILVGPSIETVAAQEATIRLRQRAEVEASIVRLRDLASVSGSDESFVARLEGTELFPTPVTERSVDDRVILERLELLGIDPFRIEIAGAARVVIAPIVRVEESVAATDRDRLVGAPLAFDLQRDDSFAERQVGWTESMTGESDGRGAFRLDPAQVERFCRVRLERQAEEAGFEWRSASLPSETNEILARGSRWLEAKLTVSEDRESVSVTMLIEQQGERIWVPIDVQVAPLQQVVFLKGAVERGRPLTLEDLEVRPFRRRDGMRTLSNTADAVGRELTVSWPADRPIDPTVLASPTLIRRGARVTVVSSVDGLSVTTSGTANGDGRMGGFVEVRLGDRRRTLTGRVVGENRVVVADDRTNVVR